MRLASRDDSIAEVFTAAAANVRDDAAFLVPQVVCEPAAFGALLATIGVDPETASPRFTFGQVELFDGLPLAAVLLPLYVYLPAFYAEDMGLGLSLVGAGLLAARLSDIVTDPIVGEEASKLMGDASAMLERIIAEQWLEARAVLGLFPANRVDHDGQFIGVGLANEEAEKAAVQASKEWLALVDNGDYGKSWETAAAFFTIPLVIYVAAYAASG